MSPITALDAQLGEFVAGSATVNVVDAVMGAVAWGPRLSAAPSLEALAGSPWLPGDPAVLARARERVVADPGAADPVSEAIQVARALDIGDDLVQIRTGFHTALDLYRAVREGRSPLAELRARQEADAVFKLLGLGTIVGRLSEGSANDRLRSVLSVPSGVALVAWFGAVEVALPFLLLTPQAAEGVLRPMVEARRAEEELRLVRLVGRAEVGRAAPVVGSLLQLADGVAVSNARRLDLLGRVAGRLPVALASSLSVVRDAAALGADALPVYRYLVARLAGELCLRRAAEELGHGASLPGPPPDLVALIREPTRSLLGVLGADNDGGPPPAPKPEPEPAPPPLPTPRPEPAPPP
ncbi:MAG: hypothetical protein D6798_03165, partial [Deltaproteobacteria bacterium]